MSGGVHICYTTSGLDELTRRKQRDSLAVAQMLVQTGRFSVFEATANEDIARTVTRLERKLGWFEYEPQTFPWTAVKLTEKGKRALLAAGLPVVPATVPAVAGEQVEAPLADELPGPRAK